MYNSCQNDLNLHVQNDNFSTTKGQNLEIELRKLKLDSYDENEVNVNFTPKKLKSLPIKNKKRL